MVRISVGATSSETRKSIHSKKLQNALADCINDNPSAKQQRLVDCSRVKGASSWLSALPLDEYGFSLHKGEFRDAILFEVWLESLKCVISL